MINKKLKTILSLIITVSLVLSVLVMPGSIVASADYMSASSVDDGVYEHTKDYEYNDGRGLYYVTFGVNGLNFYRMQTEDNQEIAISSEIWAVKNDSANAVNNFKVEISDQSDPNWTYSNLKIEQTSGPDVEITNEGVEKLPDKTGSRFEEMMAKYKVTWNYRFTFTANGEAVYNPRLKISYTSGKTSLSLYNHDTDSDNEPINLTVTVSDARQLIDILNDARTLASENAEIAQWVDYIDNNYDLSGNTYYDQTTLDSLSAELGSLFPANYTNYLNALEKAEKLLNTNAYTSEEKASVKAAIANSDEILALTKDHQAEVDAATQLINDLIRSFNPDNPGQVNSINNAAANESTSMFYCTVDGSTGVVTITMNRDTVYMDISENLSDTGLTWTYYGSFNNVHFVPGPLSSYCLGPEAENGAGNAQINQNFNTYFSNYGQGIYENNKASNLLSDTANGGGPQTVTVSLDGTPNRVTINNGEKVNLGYYWLHTKTGIGGYSRNSVDNYALSDGYNQPGFNLVVYDKSQLKNELIERYSQLRNDASNYGDYLTLLNQAQTIYDTREVTQSEIDAVITALDSFIFYYPVSVTANQDSEKTRATVELVSGNVNSDNKYAENSVVRISAQVRDYAGALYPEVWAAPNSQSVLTDYEFTQWSDGNTDIERLITVTDAVSLTAKFTFIPADYSPITTLIDIYNSYDQSLLADEYIDGVESWIDDVKWDLGRTAQASISSYASILGDLIRNPIYKQCNYENLDSALERAAAFPAVNNGSYPDAEWQAFQDAYAAAQAVDRNLTLETQNNQNTIDTAAANLESAMFTLGTLYSPPVTFYVLSSDTTKGTVDIDVTTGAKISDHTYTPNAVLSIEATATNPDYDFYQWSDGVNDNPRTISVSDGVTIEAEFVFVTADYSEINDLLAQADSIINHTISAEMLERINNLDNEEFLNDAVSAGIIDENGDILVSNEKLIEWENEWMLEYTDGQVGIDKNGNLVPVDVFADSYIQTLENARDNVPQNVGRSSQSTLDDYADTLRDLIENPVYKDCDYTDLDAALNKANNVPETNDGRYPEDVWNAYQDALEAASDIPRDLTLEDIHNQNNIDNAAANLEAAMTTLGSSRYPLIKVYDQNNNKIKEIPAAPVNNNPAAFGTLKDKLPEITTDKNHVVAGWLLDDENLVSDYQVISADMNIHPYIEYSRIVPEETSSVTVSRGDTFIVNGLTLAANTVAAVKEELLNENETLVFTRNGAELTDTDLVGTGCTIKLLSAKDPSVVYEETTVILFGDVNGDGLINSTDVDMSFNQSIGFDSIESDSVFAIAADVNHDTVIDGFDVSLIELASNSINKIEQTF